MAYDTNKLKQHSTTPNVWIYRRDDPIDTILGTDYFSDFVTRGGAEGDIIIIDNPYDTVSDEVGSITTFANISNTPAATAIISGGTLAGVTAGTVTASKAVVVDSNKDIGDFRNLDAVNFDAGASGTAGSVDVFPSTAAKGKIAITAADSAGDTTTTITNASQAAARTYTIPDAGASASFVMTEGSQTINGTKTIPALVTTNLDAGASGAAGTIDIFPTTASKGKLQLTCTDQTGDTTVTVTAGAMAAARTITLADPGGNANLVTSTGIGATQGARCTAQIDATSGTTGTTLTDITGLSVNVLAAGVYAFSAYISGVSTANSGLKLAIGGTATATSISYTGSQFNDGTCNDTSTATSIGGAVAAATAVYGYALIEGTIVVNAAGTLTVQFAQNASHADTTSVYVNSHFLVTRIA